MIIKEMMIEMNMINMMKMIIIKDDDDADVDDDEGDD